MIELPREHKNGQGNKRVAVGLGAIGLVVLGLAMAVTSAPAYAQEPTPEPVQVTVEVVIPTAVPTNTPTPIPTIDPASVGYSGPSNVTDWSVEGVVTWTTQDWDFGCPITFNTEATGAVTLCIAYTEVTGWSLIGIDIPFWPFSAALVMIIIGWLVRR